MRIGRVTSANVGACTVRVTNSGGRLSSAPVMLTVVEIQMVPGLKTSGTAGTTYPIEYTTESNNPSGWQSLATITLPTSTYWYGHLSPGPAAAVLPNDAGAVIIRGTGIH